MKAVIGTLLCLLAGTIPLQATGQQDHSKDKLLSADDYEKKCLKEDWKACEYAALLRLHGKYEKKDPVKGRALLQKACDLGSMYSCCSLGFSYRDGLWDNVNYAEAITYYKKACDNDWSDGCLHWALMLRDGLGGKQDHIAAVKLLEKACRLGNKDGCLHAKSYKRANNLLPITNAFVFLLVTLAGWYVTKRRGMGKVRYLLLIQCAGIAVYTLLFFFDLHTLHWLNITINFIGVFAAFWLKRKTSIRGSVQ